MPHKMLLPLLAPLIFAAGLPLSTSAQAGEQADRAIAAVRTLVASGQVPPGTRLQPGFKQGNISTFLGTDLALQKEWENLTGTVLDARIVPQQGVHKTLETEKGIDITVARNHEFPDLVADGLITGLDAFFAEYGFRLDDNRNDGFIRPELQAWSGGETVAVPADGDVAMLFLRRDLMENPVEQAAFRKSYGRPLAPPATWAEYEDLLRFFHRPAQGLYGCVEERDEDGAWMFWMPRFLSAVAPRADLFDAQMRPLLDTPAAIAATESYIATVKYSPPGITDNGNSYSFAMPLFAQGKAFAAMNTIAGARLFNAANSAVKGKFMAARVPGYRHSGQLQRRNTIVYGNNLVIPKDARQPRLAFLYAMWLTDPDISTRAVGVAGGFTDPYRWNHLRDARIREIYTPEALESFAGEWTVTRPPGTGLRGDRQYLAALDRNLTAAARGEINAQEAMKRTGAEWEAITERLGRAEQIRRWQEAHRRPGADS